MSDLTDIHTILSDPRAMRFWSTPPHHDIEQSREWLAAMVSAPADVGDDYIIEHDGMLIGKAGCWRLPEIGYIFRPEAWGQGFGFEALAAVIPRIFARHAIEEIIADVDPRNAGSLALLAKLGFVETHRAERTVQVGDEWCDSVYLSLRRPVAHTPA